jgi:hypothetical protein
MSSLDTWRRRQQRRRVICTGCCPGSLRATCATARQLYAGGNRAAVPLAMVAGRRGALVALLLLGASSLVHAGTPSKKCKKGVRASTECFFASGSDGLADFVETFVEEGFEMCAARPARSPARVRASARRCLLGVSRRR